MVRQPSLTGKRKSRFGPSTHMSGRLQDSLSALGNPYTQTVGKDLLCLLLFYLLFILFFFLNHIRLKTLFSSKLSLTQGVFIFKKWLCKNQPWGPPKTKQTFDIFKQSCLYLFLCPPHPHSHPSPSKSSTSSIRPLEPWHGASHQGGKNICGPIAITAESFQKIVALWDKGWAALHLRQGTLL